MSQFQFKLPDIGEGVVEAELTQWHVKLGEVVTENQVLAELLTDKATIEIPSPRAGTVVKLCCKEGDLIPVGGVLIEIEEHPGAAASTDEPQSVAPAAKATPTSVGSPAKGDVSETLLPPRPRSHVSPVALLETASPAHRNDSSDVLAVPAVREYARQQAVDLAGLSGSGPGGRIMRRDVDAALSRPKTPGTSGRGTSAGNGRSDAMGSDSSNRRRAVEPPASTGATAAVSRETDPADWTRVPLRGLRRATAERMVRSKFTAPHYTYIEEFDLTELERRRTSWQTQAGMELSPLVFIAHALVRTLPDFPEMNASLDDARGEIILKGAIHLGIATAIDAGLVVPVIRDAQGKSLLQLGEAIRQQAQRARTGQLMPADLKGSTITISSLGKLGGVAATPILNPPEVAIVATHAIRTLPRYVNAAGTGSAPGELQPRQIMNLSMSLDHRVVDGLVCARFVAALKKIVEAADFAEMAALSPESGKASGRSRGKRTGAGQAPGAGSNKP